jgi:hypothetical protein
MKIEAIEQHNVCSIWLKYYFDTLSGANLNSCVAEPHLPSSITSSAGAPSAGACPRSLILAPSLFIPLGSRHQSKRQISPASPKSTAQATTMQNTLTDSISEIPRHTKRDTDVGNNAKEMLGLVNQLDSSFTAEGV